MGDSETLGNLRHLDYSIFVHVVEVKDANELRAIRNSHKHVPLAWGTHNDIEENKTLTYVMAFGIIDLFMRSDKRGLGDRLGLAVTGMNIDTCTVLDIDPLKPPNYQVRFARMVGYHVPAAWRESRLDVLAATANADPDILKK